MKEYEKCIIHDVRYKNHSTLGNPSYWICFSDEEGNFHFGYTGSNSASGYDAPNWKYNETQQAWLKYHFTKKKGNCIIDCIKYD